MSNSCKTIVFTGIVSIITIITTWLISTNEQVSQLLGNSEIKQFALTISGGLFTGFFVLMLSEVHRYCNLKKDTETYAFFQALYLYQALFEMKINTLGALDHPSTEIMESFYDESVRKIQTELLAIQSMEYDTFISGEDSLAAMINGFRIEIPQHMSFIMQTANPLRIAVLKTQISNLKKSGYKGMVTPEDSLVQETLNKALSMLDEELNRVENLAKSIDNHCKNRYNWNAYKTSIHDNCKSIYEFGYGSR